MTAPENGTSGSSDRACKPRALVMTDRLAFLLMTHDNELAPHPVWTQPTDAHYALAAFLAIRGVTVPDPV